MMWVPFSPPAASRAGAEARGSASAPVAVPGAPRAAAAGGASAASPRAGQPISSSPRTPGALSEAVLAHAPLEAISNSQMVVDLLHDPQYK